MTEKIPQEWVHSHQFSIDTKSSEKKVNIVFAITTITMVIEIVAGTWFGSMALLADGWHMFTHSAAFAVSIFVYWYARKHQNDPAYSFGTGKVNTLGGFASAIALGTVALMMLIESITRLFSPQGIQFEEAIFVAIIGLIVNIVSAFLLHDDHHHDIHQHDHKHEHGSHNHKHHHDHNLKAAYFHVLADTLTSLLAIVALVLGKYFNWIWADALMGIIGSVVIAKWAYHLIGQSSSILLDKTIYQLDLDKIKVLIERQGTCTITDAHCWKVSGQHSCLILSIVTTSARTADDFKQLLKEVMTPDHVTIEVNRLSD